MGKETEISWTHSTFNPWCSGGVCLPVAVVAQPRAVFGVGRECWCGGVSANVVRDHSARPMVALARLAAVASALADGSPPRLVAGNLSAPAALLSYAALPCIVLGAAKCLLLHDGADQGLGLRRVSPSKPRMRKTPRATRRPCGSHLRPRCLRHPRSALHVDQFTGEQHG